MQKDTQRGNMLVPIMSIEYFLVICHDKWTFKDSLKNTMPLGTSTIHHGKRKPSQLQWEEGNHGSMWKMAN